MKVPKDHRRLDIGTSVHDNPGFQLEHYHVLVANLTHLAAAIPLPTRLLHLFPQLHLGKADVDHYKGGACGDAYIPLG
jgi:hypothetical protein